jgi:hypothetical protein
MRIQEAIKSGKPFKRKLWRDWHTVDAESQWFVNTATDYRVVLSARDVLAEDWEVKPEKKIRMASPHFPHHRRKEGKP